MLINPIDIMIVLFLVLVAFFGYKNGFIVEIKKTFSLITGIILTNLIIKNLSQQFYFLSNRVDILFIFIFLTILILLILLITFILNIFIEQIDEIHIDKYLNFLLGSTIGMIRGIIILSVLIFIFDTTPIDSSSKEKLYAKVETKSLLFKQCNSLKNLLFKN